MADRNTLHISKLELFERWLMVEDGWDIRPLSKNPYEVLRATKVGRKHPLIVYRKVDSKEHLSVADRDYPVVRAFLKRIKETHSQGDHMREMNNEEMAKQLTEVVMGALKEYVPRDILEEHVVFHRKDDEKKHLEWLNSEVKM